MEENKMARQAALTAMINSKRVDLEALGSWLMPAGSELPHENQVLQEFCGHGLDARHAAFPGSGYIQSADLLILHPILERGEIGFGQQVDHVKRFFVALGNFK